MDVWKGVIIEESLENKEILEDVEVMSQKTSKLESEEGKGTFHFDKVNVSDLVIEKVVRKAKKGIKQGWYMHLCKQDVMIVIFKDKSFRYIKGDKEGMKEIRSYGTSVGINEAQLPDERLIKAQVGERVLSIPQNRDYEAGMRAAGGSRPGENGSGGGPVNLSISIDARGAQKGIDWKKITKNEIAPQIQKLIKLNRVRT